MQLNDFANVFGVLALQLRAGDTDEATVRAYYEALKEFQLESIQRSAANLATEQDRRFFPTTAEWASAAQVARTQLLRANLLTAREQPWQFECLACEDTGWTLHQCEGDEICGRRHLHLAHSFAKPCFCRPTNATYQRHHQVGRTSSV